MSGPDFRHFLVMCTTLNNEQRGILRSGLCEPPHQSCQLYERLEQNFSAHPRRQHCHSEDVRKYGSKVTANAINVKPMVVHSMP